jgi:hypothetical protein
MLFCVIFHSYRIWARVQGPMCMRVSCEWGALRKDKQTAGTPQNLLGAVCRSYVLCLKYWIPVTTTSPW